MITLTFTEGQMNALLEDSHIFRQVVIDQLKDKDWKKNLIHTLRQKFAQTEGIPAIKFVREYADKNNKPELKPLIDAKKFVEELGFNFKGNCVQSNEN